MRRTDDAQGIRLQNDHCSQTEDQETAETRGSQEEHKEVTLRRPESVVESDLSVWTLIVVSGEAGKGLLTHLRTCSVGYLVMWRRKELNDHWRLGG